MPKLKTAFWEDMNPHNIHWRLLIDIIFFAAIAVATFNNATLVSTVVWIYVLLRVPMLLSYLKWTKSQAKTKEDKK